MKTILHLSMAAAGLLLSATLAAQTVNLNLRKAVKYEAVTTTKAVTTVEAMGQSMEMNADSKSTTVYEVKDIRNTETDLVKTITRIITSASAMGQEMNYDSDKKDNDAAMADALGASIGKNNNITIDGSGKVLKSDAPKNTNTGQLGMMNGMLMNSAANEVEELLLGSILNRTVSAGLQWQDSIVIKEDKMSMKISGTYTVAAIENDHAKLIYQGTQTTTGTVEQQGMEFNTTGNNKITGEASIDLKTGVATLRKTSIAINMTIEGMGMSFPATGTSTTTTEVKAIQ